MKKLLILTFCGLLSYMFVGCEEEKSGVKPEPAAAAVYVLNGIGTTISVIDLDADTVYNDVAAVGTWPNQLVYRDGKVYCVNSGTNNIMIFNETTWSAETPIDLGTGHNPMNMAFYDDNTVYVTASVSNKVLKVNVASKTVEKEIDAGVGTTGLAISQGKVYATNTAFDGSTFTYGQGTVTVIDGATGNVTKTVNVTMNPFSADVAPDGKIHVVCTGDYWSHWGRVYVIDPATDTVVDSVLTQGSPGLIDISESSKLAYLAQWGKGCLVYNTETLAMVSDTTDYLLGAGGSGVLADPEGNVFVSDWDGDRVVKLTSGGTVVSEYAVGDGPSALALKVTE